MHHKSIQICPFKTSVSSSALIMVSKSWAYATSHFDELCECPIFTPRGQLFVWCMLAKSFVSLDFALQFWLSWRPPGQNSTASRGFEFDWSHICDPSGDAHHHIAPPQCYGHQNHHHLAFIFIITVLFAAQPKVKIMFCQNKPRIKNIIAY